MKVSAVTRPRFLQPFEWKDWSRYSFSRITHTTWKEFGEYLQSRVDSDDLPKSPTLDVMFETYINGSWQFYALVLQRSVGSYLYLDYLSVDFDEIDGDQDDKINIVADILDTLREFALEGKKNKTFPDFNSHVLNTKTVGAVVLNAASSLSNILIEYTSENDIKKLELTR